MFERARIGGAIYNLGDELTRQGVPVHRGVRELYAPFMDIAVRDMKSLRLKADQAAVALIINMVSIFQQQGVLKTLFNEQYDLFISLVRLYHGACNLMHTRPDYFARARALYDDDVFEAVERITL